MRDLGWIGRHLNVLITGPTGIGKSFIGAALAHAACRANFCVRCFRMPRLIDELGRAHAFQRRSNFLRSLAKADLLLIDDFAIAPLSDQSKRDLLEILDDRYDKSATIITRQLKVKQWHAYLDDPTLADAILDRVVHNAYQLDLSGESIRKLKSLRAKNAKNGGTQPKGSASIAAPAAFISTGFLSTQYCERVGKSCFLMHFGGEIKLVGSHSELRNASKSGVGFQGVERLGEIPARRQKASSASRFICRLVVM